MKYIKLTKGYEAMVDDVDYPILNKLKWYFHNNGYAIRKLRTGVTRMHREILGLTDKKVFCDHINGNKLDNRRLNLRICSKSQNQANRRGYKNNKSGFKGVYWDKVRGLFASEIRFNNQRFHLGRFASIIQAAKAYNVAALEYHGAFSRLNIIK